VRGINNLLVSKRNILKSVLCTLFSKELLPISKVLYNMILSIQTLAEGICKPIDNAWGVKYNNKTLISSVRLEWTQICRPTYHSVKRVNVLLVGLLIYVGTLLW